MGISCDRKGIHASMLETVSKGHSLIITDASAMVEAVAYKVPEDSANKAPDRCTAVHGSDGSCAVWGSSGDLSVPFRTERLPLTNLYVMRGLGLLLVTSRVPIGRREMAVQPRFK